MSILIDKSTRLIVQGITGRDGLFHAKKMNEYGTNVVGGTSCWAVFSRAPALVL